MTPLACAQHCADLYAGGEFALQWDKDGVVVGLRRVPGIDIVVLRGSVTAEDWIRDAEFSPQWDEQLGYCHSGFLEGMRDVFSEVVQALRPGAGLVITGHSLGGARARILAGLCLANGVVVTQLTVFGSPKPGFLQLAKIIGMAPNLEHSSFRNRADIVPGTPPSFLGFVHTEAFTGIDSGAPGGLDPEPFADHQIALYVKALMKGG